jgi:hypothetical protein
LDFSSFCNVGDGFNFVITKESSLHSVASRHWYKTGCDFSERVHAEPGVADVVTLARLPGSFTMRGDWFLGTTRSSRSRLLAHYAIDLLSSRRANLSRMQLGLGLPVRDVLSDEMCGKLRTALRCELDKSAGYVSYKDLVDRCAGKSDGKESTGRLLWLWRSSIRDYDRQSRVLSKWLARIFNWTVQYQRERGTNWEGGFHAYDGLSRGAATVIAKYDSFVEFAEHCDLLIAELEAASRPIRDLSNGQKS